VGSFVFFCGFVGLGGFGLGGLGCGLFFVGVGSSVVLGFCWVFWGLLCVGGSFFGFFLVFLFVFFFLGLVCLPWVSYFFSP